MQLMQRFNCDNCGEGFIARVADRKRGWARFCSKSCKAVKQNRDIKESARRLKESSTASRKRRCSRARPILRAAHL